MLRKYFGSAWPYSAFILELTSTSSAELSSSTNSTGSLSGTSHAAQVVGGIATIKTTTVTIKFVSKVADSTAPTAYEKALPSDSHERRSPVDKASLSTSTSYVPRIQ